MVSRTGTAIRGNAKALSKTICIALTKARKKAKKNKYEIHHIAAQRASAAEYSRRILNKVGVGIHSETNKVPVKYNLHRHLHTNSYHNRTLIQTAYTKSVNKRNAVIATLYYIRTILLSANKVTP